MSSRFDQRIYLKSVDTMFGPTGHEEPLSLHGCRVGPPHLTRTWVLGSKEGKASYLALLPGCPGEESDDSSPAGSLPCRSAAGGFLDFERGISVFLVSWTIQLCLIQRGCGRRTVGTARVIKRTHCLILKQNRTKRALSFQMFPLKKRSKIH